MAERLHGIVTEIDRKRQRGAIRGEDGQVRWFERENMLLWLQFLDLTPGDRVTFEIEGAADAINVERCPS